MKQKQLIGHKKRVSAISITPDGEQIITGSHDCTIKVWHTRSGGLLRSWNTQEKIAALGLDLSIEMVISMSNHHSVAMIKKWDFTQGDLLFQSPANIPASKASISRNGLWALIAHENKGMLWDIDQNEISSCTMENNQVVSALINTPDGRTSVFGTENGMLYVWDIKKEKEIFQYGFSGNSVTAVGISDNSKIVCCATQDHNIRVFYPEKKEIHVFRDHIDEITAMEITHDQQQLISISLDGVINIWNIETGDVLSSRNLDAPLSSCVVTPDGLTLVVGDANGKVYIILLDKNIKAESQGNTMVENNELDNLVKKGERLLGTENFEEALSCFKQAIKLEPKNWRAQTFHLIAMDKLDRYQETVDFADQILDNELVSGDLLAAVYFYKGSALIGLDQDNLALDAFNRGLEIDDKFGKLWYQRGAVLLFLGDYEEAIKSFQKVQELNWSEETEAQIGLCYLHLEDFKNANVTLQPLIDNGSEHPAVFYVYGLYLIGVNKIDQACKWLRLLLNQTNSEYTEQAYDILSHYCE